MCSEDGVKGHEPRSAGDLCKLDKGAVASPLEAVGKDSHGGMGTLDIRPVGQFVWL